MLLSKRTRCQHVGEPLLEALEGRMLLNGDVPFPSLADLENPNNTVVRMDTNMGTIFFELYDVAGPNGASAAPLTVSNFLNYIRRGDYDQSFFHRLAYLTTDPTVPFVLQGGGFRFFDGGPVGVVPQGAQIMNEFDAARGNVERSIAMAKLAPPPQGPPNGGPNSATNQFFINLRDNRGSPAFLDAENGGYTVFGRVADDASWAVVQSIVGLNREDLRQEFTGEHSSNFSTVPTLTDIPDGQLPAASQLVTILDIEVVKARDTTQFFTEKFFYAEGFAGSTINEFLPMANPNDQIVHYQVIVRAEVPQGDNVEGFTWYRDRVIGHGSIQPGQRGGLTISAFGENGAPGINDLVPQGVPYSIEVWATAPLAVNISHYDFGTSTGEAFTQTLDTTWAFGQAEKANGVADFLVWSNPNLTPVNIEVTFIFSGQASRTINVVTGAMRRGGLALGQFGNDIIPENSVFSIIVEADQEIVAALTHFDARNATDPVGSATLGVPGAGSRFGVLPLAQAGTNNTDVIAVVNPTSVSAVVNFTITFADANDNDIARPAALIIPPNSRGTFNVAATPGLGDRRYSVRFDSNTAVYATWLHSHVFGTVPSNRDHTSNPVSDIAATRWRFAEGFMDPARAGQDVFETISVYNPNSMFFAGQNTTANVTFTFRYTDGFTVTETRQVAGGKRVDLDVHTLNSILQQGTNNGRYFFWIEVSSDVPVVAQMWHFDLTLGGLQPSGGFATLGTAGGTIVRLDALGSAGIDA